MSNARVRLMALLVVVATAAALSVGSFATAPKPVAEQAESAQRVTRSMACVTAAPGGEAVVGSLTGTMSSSTRAKGGRVGLNGVGSVLRVKSDEAAASTAFASQSVRRGPSYAAQSCPEPSRQQWFLGTGSGRLHHSTLTLVNTRSGDAIVDVTVVGKKGEIPTAGLDDITVGKQPVVLDLARVAASVDTTAIGVTAVRGLVAATVTDTWAPSETSRELVEYMPAQADPTTDLTVAGLPKRYDEATLFLLNHGDAAAVVQLRLTGRRGSFASTKHRSITAPPGALTTVVLPTDVRGDVGGLRLSTDQPLSAGVRVLSDRDVTQLAAQPPVGERTVTGIPTGARSQVWLVNPDEKSPVEADVQFVAADRKVQQRTSVTIAPGALISLDAPMGQGGPRAVRVDGGGAVRGVVVLQAPRGRAVLPMSSATGETRVPRVVQSLE